MKDHLKDLIDDCEGRTRIERDNLKAQLNQATAILRRNLGKLRNDHTPNPEQSRQDYLDACRLCGVEPEDYS